MTSATDGKADTTASTRIECKICGALTHSIQYHLGQSHIEKGGITSIEEYTIAYPGAPLMSEVARRKMADLVKSREAAKSVSSDEPHKETQMFDELFSLNGSSPATKSKSGKSIPITVLIREGAIGSDMIPDIDANYLFPVEILKRLMMGIEKNMPVYLWGHAGTGKTTIFEQIAARTNRPFLRVQHTANMEEEHVVGGWRLRDGKTIFELGPLAMAMKYGWLYMADEYDFGRPEVASVYQAVLEGKPLVIKEADHENRVIRPHHNFRFAATGNTNGQGDESGLYQGTNIQNAANYERFAVTLQMPYMEKTLEARLVSQQARIPVKDAEKLVDFASRIRSEFDGGRMANPVSPRSLVYAAKLGVAMGDYRAGVELAFINRLTTVDRESASQLAQRVFS